MDDDIGRLRSNLQDIAELKRAEGREGLVARVLDILNRSDDTLDTIHELLAAIKGMSGIEAVGIRLRKGPDYPYYDSDGFVATHVPAENSLCATGQDGKPVLDEDGKPVLECMCGNIIRGRTDPSKPFFTKGGSFWTNGTTELLAATTGKDRQGRTRNRCNSEGYESVALVPLRSGAEIIGLLQLNDQRKGAFTPASIELFENIGNSVGIALLRNSARDEVGQSEARYRALFENMKSGVAVYEAVDAGKDFIFCQLNRAGEEIDKIGRADIIGKRLTEVFRGAEDFGLLALLRRVWTTGRPERLADRFYKDDRISGWRENRVYKLPSGEVVAVYSDITALKEMEAGRRRSENELAIQNRIAGIFLTIADEDMYTEVLNVVLSYMDSRLGVFGYIDEKGALVVPSMTRHAWDRCQVADKTHVFPRETWGDSSWPQALREKKPVWSNETSTRVPHGHVQVQRHISMPIVHKGEVIGLFQVANRDTDYTEEDVRRLRTVADHVAPVLHARLERDRREAERDRALAELATHRDHLEELVSERTRELEEANATLMLEMSERRRAEERLRDVSRYNREIIETSLDPLVTISASGKITDVNRAIELATGVPREKLVGSDFSDYFTEPEKARAGYREAFSKGHVRDYPLALRHVSGKVIEVLYNASVYRNEKGEVQGVTAAARDITLRKRAELLARKGAERAGILLNIHKQASQPDDRELFGYALDSAVALTDSEIGFFHRVSEDRKEIILTTWNNGARRTCTAAFETHYPVEQAGNWVDSMRQMRPVIYNDFPSSPNQKGLPDGHAPVARFMSIPVIEGGKVRLIFGVGNKSGEYDQQDVDNIQLIANELHKVVEIRRLNEDLRRHAAELEAANAELESFAYSVSHDLRAPLRAMDGFSQAIQEECGDRLDDLGREYLEKVRSACLRMSSLIDHLLELSKVTRSEMRRERVDLSAMAREILEGLSRAEPGRRVRTGVLAGLEASGDPDLLRVALENLLSNAWKFTSKAESPYIEFGGGVRDGAMTYFVRDNGVGFDMKYAGKLFGPFQRLHSTAEFPGTGIGLATVKRIINRHGGRVWALSELGKGATFQFMLG